MGRYPLVSLGDAEAREFRSLVRAKVKSNGLRQIDLINLRGRQIRSERWIQNALSNCRRLAKRTAREIIDRLILAGVLRSPSAIRPFGKLLPPDESTPRAKLAIFPGQSALLAEALADAATHVLGVHARVKRDLVRAFKMYLRDYEDVFTDASPLTAGAGALIIQTLDRNYGKVDWMQFFDGRVRKWLAVRQMFIEELPNVRKQIDYNSRALLKRRRRASVTLGRQSKKGANR